MFAAIEGRHDLIDISFYVCLAVGAGVPTVVAVCASVVQRLRQEGRSDVPDQAVAASSRGGASPITLSGHSIYLQDKASSRAPCVDAIVEVAAA